MTQMALVTLCHAVKQSLFLLRSPDLYKINEYTLQTTFFSSDINISEPGAEAEDGFKHLLHAGHTQAILTHSLTRAGNSSIFGKGIS